MKNKKLYVCIFIWIVLSLLYLIFRVSLNDGGKIILSIVYIIFLVGLINMSFYGIAQDGDKFIKEKEPELYNEYYIKYGKYTLRPMFIAFQLLLTKRYKNYPILKSLVFEALVYAAFSLFILISFVFATTAFW